MNDVIINNLTKLYNITCACSFIQDYIFQIETPFYFLKTLNLQNQEQD